MQAQPTKFMALRAKTDRDLFTILSKELAVALKLAERDPATARKTHDRALTLFPGMRCLSHGQKWMLGQRIRVLGERLGEMPRSTARRWFVAGAARGAQGCAPTG